MALRAYCFVDCAYLRASLEGIQVEWQEINLRDVSNYALQTVKGRWQGEEVYLSRVFAYDAVPDDADDTIPVEKWLKRNGEIADLHVRRGHLVLDQRGNKRRQKGVDVQLTVDALKSAVSGVMDVSLFIAGDADFVPLFEAIRERGPLVAASTFPTSISDHFKEALDRVGYLPLDPAAWNWKLAPVPEN